MASDLLLVAMVLIGLGTIGGLFPLWKSTRLSPDSIQRRVYWTCSATAAILCFLSQLPDWRGGLFIGVGIALALVAVALNWTSHVKIGGRIYAVFPNLRRPDRPPALSKDSRAAGCSTNRNQPLGGSNQ